MRDINVNGSPWPILTIYIYFSQVLQILVIEFVSTCNRQSILIQYYTLLVNSDLSQKLRYERRVRSRAWTFFSASAYIYMQVAGFVFHILLLRKRSICFRTLPSCIYVYIYERLCLREREREGALSLRHECCHMVTGHALWVLCFLGGGLVDT